METFMEGLRLLTELAVALGVLWNLITTHRTSAKIDAGAVSRAEISQKIDVLTTQTNGLAANLAAGNKAIGAADARREDKDKAAGTKAP